MQAMLQLKGFGHRFPTTIFPYMGLVVDFDCFVYELKMSSSNIFKSIPRLIDTTFQSATRIAEGLVVSVVRC